MAETVHESFFRSIERSKRGREKTERRKRGKRDPETGKRDREREKSKSTMKLLLEKTIQETFFGGIERSRRERKLEGNQKPTMK